MGFQNFRLPKAIVQHEINGLKEMGVDIQTNVVIGRSESVDDLFDGLETCQRGNLTRAIFRPRI